MSVTVLSTMLIIGGFSIYRNGAIALTPSDLDTFKQQNIEKYQELGEKGFIKDCTSGIMDMPRSICQKIADSVRDQMISQQENQTSNFTSTSLNPETHFAFIKGLSINYPSDWHVLDNGIVKGTREFSIQIFNDSKYSILDTPNFADIMRCL